MADFSLNADNAINGRQLDAEILAATGLTVDHQFVPPRLVRIAGVEANDVAEVAAVIAAHVPNPDWGVSPQEIVDRPLYAGIQTDLAALETKARAVRAGTDTFTAAQSQKILAALVLRELRRL